MKRVEVSVDGGKNWHVAELQTPILPKAHTRFRLWWHWNGKPTVIQSRCIDETGYTQPTVAELRNVRTLKGGAFGSVYHYNAIQSWAIDKSGRVSDVHHVA
ncbi:MAG: hypothetical protein U5L11_17380 [Arhodomonas sp.]|nr:hypothetical protein [Arhodomonas sp.]